MSRTSTLPRWAAHHLAAVRVVLALTLLVGLAYPLGMTLLAQAPGLRDASSRDTLIGKAYTDSKGNPVPGYFQSRPSNAGDGYDTAASGAGNQGAESVVDTPDKLSLLTQVCARSKAVGELEDVDGSRPYCTPDGVGAVLGVFRDGGTTGRVTRVVSLNQACPARPFVGSYEHVAVGCAEPGADYSRAVVTPVRGDAPARPEVPADAVTASGSGLDPDISPAYAGLQAPRIARERGIGEDTVRALIARYTTGRALGVLGEPAVNVVELNAALDRTHPTRGA
ncbi:potassium-transporting ATPase subunit C [Streptomyces sp. NPDC026673]|uniref:potassium-transporting ATPase subunit C n=1 Tax=Streptomyces sp. NPDC026673 TaxID=3155724 RepID=UPI0033F9788F